MAEVRYLTNYGRLMRPTDTFLPGERFSRNRHQARPFRIIIRP